MSSHFVGNRKNKKASRKTVYEPAPYTHKAKDSEPRKKEVPKTAAQPAAAGWHKNITLADCMNVFKFIDDHLHLSQIEVIAHFNQKDGSDGALTS